MTNGEKYKTAQECAKAYCQSKMDTSFLDGNFCEKFKQFMAWLDLECEEEKPLPCPFCGDEVKLLKAENHRYMQCNNCNCTYTSGGAFSEVEAIAAHNRVAKAAKESEAK